MITMKNHNSRFPFTSSQWQELEHQALVYKYMVSGIPIPPHLLFSIKTTFMDPSTKLIFQFPHQPFGWDCFHMGYGRKIDPEPGRCRRTDGKKWRCSKEAFGDSKYCERHMHRGRNNRSRKPVEAARVGSEKDLLMSSGTITASAGDSWLLEPLAVNNSAFSLADYHTDHSYLQLQNSPLRQKLDQDQGRCYDLKVKGKDEAHKLIHHFFDESPHNDDNDRNKDKDSSTTQLSISIPSSGHDFFLTRNNK